MGLSQLSGTVPDVHLLRDSFKYLSRQGRGAISRARKPVYQSVNVLRRGGHLPRILCAQSGTEYPAAPKPRENARAELVWM